MRRVTVVVHQIQSPDNLGAIARVMTNFGFSELVLSDPQTDAFGEAGKLAVKSEQVLDAIRIEPTLEAALSDCVFAIGTSSRPGPEGRPMLSPEAAIERLAEQAKGGKVALVFGGERRGLSDQELSLCQEITRIPTQPAQPSLNLAQSVAVLLYLCGRASSDLNDAPAQPDPASRGTFFALSQRMREVLLAVGFLNPQAPDYVARELDRCLNRADLSQREAELWLGAFKQIERVIRSLKND